MANKKFKSDASINWEVFRTNLQKLLDSRGLTATDFALSFDCFTFAVFYCIYVVAVADLWGVG